jgi:hypothetical protein
MSIERHPNINAAGFTADIYMGYLQRLRGMAAKSMTEQTMEILSSRVGQFVTEISIALDEQFGTEMKGRTNNDNESGNKGNDPGTSGKGRG